MPKSEQLLRLAQAAGVIRDVIGCDFDWDAPGHGEYGKGAMLILLHPPGSELRAYCNYDCYAYDKIERMADALSAIGLYVEDCNGYYSGLYEVSNAESAAG